jgi:dipeptidyl aminopeptidase/acylaminoacyl peptidase
VFKYASFVDAPAIGKTLPDHSLVMPRLIGREFSLILKSKRMVQSAVVYSLEGSVMKSGLRFLLVLLLPGLLCAQTKHTPPFDEILSLETISSPKISPDGRFVAYQMSEANWKDNEYVSQWWLVNVATGAALQLTRGKKSARQAEWSPDGRWLAFVTERESSAIEPPSAETKGEKKKEESPSQEKEETKEEGKEAEAGATKPAAHQIWMISPEGGEAWQLTKSEADVGGFHWSKDGKSIAFFGEST